MRDEQRQSRAHRYLPGSLFPDLVEKNNHNDTSKENYKAMVSDGLLGDKWKLVFVGGRRCSHVWFEYLKTMERNGAPTVYRSIPLCHYFVIIPYRLVNLKNSKGARG